MRQIRSKAIAFAVLLVVGFAPVRWARAQESEAQPSGKTAGAGWQWLEQFSGSANSEGQVMALSSTGGYNFNSRVGLFAGLPVYFIHNSSSAAGTSSEDGIGDVFFGLRLSFPNQILNYRMTMVGTGPTGDAAKGLSTGHPTFDWSNHFDHRFGRWTPFANLGLADSVPDTLYYQRAYVSYGYLAHLQAGTTVRLFRPLSVAVSGYDIDPWGSQVVTSRLVPVGATGVPILPPGMPGLLGALANQPAAFEEEHITTGGANLTRDYGASAGFDVNIASLFEVWIGDNYSVPLSLNTVSFGIAANMRNFVGRSRNSGN